MAVTTKELLHIAKLSKLRVTAEETERLLLDMESIIKMVDTLSELDLKEPEGGLIDFDNVNVMREDVIKPSFSRDEILKNAPQKKAGCVAVPRVIDDKGE